MPLAHQDVPDAVPAQRCQPHPVAGRGGRSIGEEHDGGFVGAPWRGSPVHVGGAEVGEDLQQPGRALHDEDVKERRTRLPAQAQRGHEAAGVEPLLVRKAIEELEHGEDNTGEALGEHAEHAGHDARAHVVQRAYFHLERLLPKRQESVGIVRMGHFWPWDGPTGVRGDKPVS
jgi:hypothetical protein